VEGGIISFELTFTAFTVVTLNALICAELDRPFTTAIFTKYFIFHLSPPLTYKSFFNQMQTVPYTPLVVYRAGDCYNAGGICV
jgi:hypothetical protein